eukprot:13340758-Alexandrium_andersonii.AAC.1
MQNKYTWKEHPQAHHTIHPHTVADTDSQSKCCYFENSMAANRMDTPMDTSTNAITDTGIASNTHSLHPRASALTDTRTRAIKHRPRHADTQTRTLGRGTADKGGSRFRRLRG